MLPPGINPPAYAWPEAEITRPDPTWQLAFLQPYWGSGFAVVFAESKPNGYSALIPPDSPEYGLHVVSSGPADEV